MGYFQIILFMLWLYIQGGKSYLYSNSPRFILNQKNCICYDKNVYPTIPETIAVANGVDTTLGYLFNQKSLTGDMNSNIENPTLVRLNIEENGNAYIGDANIIIDGIKYQISLDGNNQFSTWLNGEIILTLKYNEDDLKHIISRLKKPMINLKTVLRTDDSNNKLPENYVSLDQNPAPPTTIEKSNSITNGNPDKNELNYLLHNSKIYQTVKSENDTPNFDLSNIIGEYKNFDDWLNKKIEILKLNYEIKIYELYRLVKTLLQKHGIIITESGLLDLNNHEIIDLADLKLHPIFIGQSMDATFILPIRSFNNSLYNLPMDIKYLEGLMLTLYSPPKVLGIVPIRTKYMYSAEANEKFMNANSVIYFASGSDNESFPCLQNKECKDFNSYQLLLNNVNSDQNAVIINTEVQEEVEDSVDVYQISSELTVGSLTELFRTIFDEPPAQVKQEATTNPETNSDVYPIYRIIGGNAATSSGTPVSTKGRSGFIDKIVINT